MTKYMQSKKTMYRNSSIELLRIISMVRMCETFSVNS